MKNSENHIKVTQLICRLQKGYSITVTSQLSNIQRFKHQGYKVTVYILISYIIYIHLIYMRVYIYISPGLYKKNCATL